MTIAGTLNSSIRRGLAALLIAASVIACSDSANEPTNASQTSFTTSTASASSTRLPTTTVQLLRVDVISRRPHDRRSFTEGLVMAGGRLYEGSGLRGESTLREVDPQTGVVDRSIAIDRPYFGEGIAVVDDRIIQLTWQEHTAFVYQLSDFKRLTTFSYDTEGWGLCDDGTRLVMSDGSNQLYFRDRSTFALKGKVTVTNNGTPVDQLNELECVDGQVYANVWQTDTIVRIDPSNGNVTALIDAAGLLGADAGAVDVLNGIAYDPTTKTFLLTGKLWPTMFEVRFVPR